MSDQMLCRPCLRSAHLFLRPLVAEDVTPAYVAWLNDPNVNACLEVRHTPQTFEDVVRYVVHREKKWCDGAGEHFGVFDMGGTRHIGMITLNSLNKNHSTVDVSFIIGHSDARGKGYATEAVHAVCAYVFRVRHLHKVTGGHYASLLPSLRVFQKNGFQIEGVRREMVINACGEREDIIMHGLLASEFVSNPAYIGGGFFDTLVT